MVRDGLESMYALSIENPYTRTLCFISRTYVLFFYEISLCILYIKCIKLCINIHLLKKIKKSILKIF